MRTWSNSYLFSDILLLHGTRGGYSKKKKWVGVCAARFPKPFPYLRPKSAIFRYPMCYTWPLINTLFEMLGLDCRIPDPLICISLNKNSNYCYLPCSSKHTDTCKWLGWVFCNSAKGSQLLLKKPTQFKTRVQKPRLILDQNLYPIFDQNC